MSRFATAFVLGYHGCERAVAERIVARQEVIKPSKKSYDWLGHGVYFWESDPLRAQEWAEERVARGEITNPSVIGAAIDLGNCLDLLQRENMDLVRGAYETLSATHATEGRPLPKNRSGRRGVADDKPIRELDCAVIQALHINIQDVINRSPSAGFQEFDTVRCLFPEGDELYPDSGFRNRSHVQIAVRSLGMIKGIFLYS